MEEKEQVDSIVNEEKQEETENSTINKPKEDAVNDIDSDKLKTENEDSTNKASNEAESKKVKSKEQKAKNTQDKTKETPAENQKEKKQKRQIKEIVGLNFKKDVIVLFKDSTAPEIVKMDEMKSNYSRDLLTFYESKFNLVDNCNNEKSK